MHEPSGSSRPRLHFGAYVISMSCRPAAASGRWRVECTLLQCSPTFLENQHKEEKAMRNVWKAWAIAAAMVVTTVAASAQETALKANVPFEFSINGGANLAAGDYIVTRDRNLWLVRSEETG